MELLIKSQISLSENEAAEKSSGDCRWKKSFLLFQVISAILINCIPKESPLINLTGKAKTPLSCWKVSYLTTSYRAFQILSHSYFLEKKRSVELEREKEIERLLMGESEKREREEGREKGSSEWKFSGPWPQKSSLQHEWERNSVQVTMLFLLT